MEIFQNETLLAIQMPKKSIQTLQFGQSIETQVPPQFAEMLNLDSLECLQFEIKGNTLKMTKQRRKRTLEEMVFERTGLTLDEYVKKHPYDPSPDLDDWSEELAQLEGTAK